VSAQPNQSRSGTQWKHTLSYNNHPMTFTGAKLVSRQMAISMTSPFLQIVAMASRIWTCVLGAIGSSSPFPAVTSQEGVKEQPWLHQPVLSATSQRHDKREIVFELRLQCQLGRYWGPSSILLSPHTAGTTWEYSVIQFPRFTGNPSAFESTTALTFTSRAASQYVASVAALLARRA